MRKGRIALILLAVAAVALTLFNASWLASSPPGRLTVIAHRGTAQMPNPDVGGGDCPAAAMRPNTHTYIENSIFAMRGAIAYGAGGFLLDVRPSADGQAMIFRDPTLECRTDGTGRVSDRPLEYLKRLDVGHGYTADGGETFPLRGRGVGAMPTAAEVIREFPRRQLVFALHEPAAADAVVRAFRETGVPIGEDHGFVGPPESLARLRTLTQSGWVLDFEASETCLDAYRRTGWLGIVPDECEGTTLLVPRDGEWTLWGWPYRFLNRLAAADARFLIVDGRDGYRLKGLDRPEQLGEVPRHYRGLLLVEDMFDVGRSLQRP